MISIRTLLFAALAIVSSFVGVRAEESASTLAKKLETQILASHEVVMSFKSPKEGRISLKADLKGKRVRLESPSVLILSDGKTIWNINKQTNRVTIDAVSSHSPFRDPAAVFRFSQNYLAQLASHTGSSYTLDLVPGKELADLFKQTGDNQQLRVSLKVSGASVRILRAKALTSKGESSTGPVTITQLKSTKASDFEFQRTPKMSIIDLRE
jgi:outer membrane lipoprotein-sorting protein